MKLTIEACGDSYDSGWLIRDQDTDKHDVLATVIATGDEEHDRDVVLPLVRLFCAAPRLRDAADALLTNLIDAKEYGPAHGDACPEDGLPCDEDGKYWYSDAWELKLALDEANGVKEDPA